MNRLYKPFLILTYLLLFGAFTSTSFGQVPVGGASDVALTTTYAVPTGLDPASLDNGVAYDLYVLTAVGDVVIGVKLILPTAMQMVILD